MASDKPRTFHPGTAVQRYRRTPNRMPPLRSSFRKPRQSGLSPGMRRFAAFAMYMTVLLGWPGLVAAAGREFLWDSDRITILAHAGTAILLLSVAFGLILALLRLRRITDPAAFTRMQQHTMRRYVRYIAGCLVLMSMSLGLAAYRIQDSLWSGRVHSDAWWWLPGGFPGHGSGGYDASIYAWTQLALVLLAAGLLAAVMPLGRKRRHTAILGQPIPSVSFEEPTSTDASRPSADEI